MNRRKTYTTLLLSLITITTILAQSPYTPKALYAEDYVYAQKFMSQGMNSLVKNGYVRVAWLDDNQCWYRLETSKGDQIMLVNAKKKSQTIVSMDQIPKVERTGPLADRNSIVSPDGTQAAFIKDYNLWVKTLSDGSELQLTHDGIEDFGYATNNAGWTKSDRPVLLWSPDSKKIATFQHDGRGVGEMYMFTTNAGHPKLEAWKYPLPEDSVIFRIHRVIIDLDGPKVIRLKMDPDQHRGTTIDHVATRNGLGDAEWSDDSRQFAFVSSSRDHKEAILRIADAATGPVRTILDEKVDTYFESGARAENWRVLEASNEAIWYSERSNWGHLYLYDLTTGKVKNSITSGDWIVLQLLKVDEKNRTLYFTGAGREPGDPYFQYYYSVKMDGSNLKLLTPDSANHSVSFSPSWKYLTDTWSTPQDPPVTELRDLNGKKLLSLAKGDISALIESGWKPPVSFSVKARDGKTDLYGMMFVPTHLDPNKKYPIINSIYPGPQSGSVGGRSFSVTRGDRQALAELGFIVITLDAMGTPGRSKSFHDAYYGNMGDNGLPDQVTGMKQLAARYPWIDIDRAGIYGHSGGGFASTDAMFRYPDFFKVAVSGSGNHDNRVYEDDWGEKWQGLLTTNPDGTTSYDNQANQLQAKNLKGKLLITHGTMDGNVPVNNTLLVVQELIRANKDFDLILFPNAGHGYGEYTNYMTRRRWDYFVKNLLGAEPPAVQ